MADDPAGDNSTGVKECLCDVIFTSSSKLSPFDSELTGEAGTWSYTQ